MPLSPRWKRRITIIICIIAGLAFIPAIALEIFLSPQRIAKLVNHYAGEYLTAEVKLEKADISLLRAYPFVSLQLENGCVISGGDSLVAFKNLSVSAHLPSLLSNHLSLKKIYADSLRVYLHARKDGTASWDVVAPDTTASASDTTASEFRITADRLQCPNYAMICYYDQESGLYYRGRFQDLELERRGRDAYRIRTDSSLQDLRISEEEFFSSLPFEARGQVGLGEEFVDNLASGAFQIIDFHLFTGVINSIPTYWEGSAEFLTDSLQTALRLDIPETDIQSLIDLVPENLFPSKKQLEINLRSSIALQAKGAYIYQTGALPNLDLELQTNRGQARYLDYSPQWHQIEARMKGVWNPSRPDSCSLRIDSLFFNGSGARLTAAGHVSNFLSRPDIALNLNGKACLDSLPEAFLKEQGITASGNLLIKAVFDGRLDQLSLNKIGQTSLQSEFDAASLKFDMPKQGIHIVSDSTHLTAWTRPKNKTDNLHLDFHTDSLLLAYGNDLLVEASSTNLGISSSKGSFSGDTSRIHPLSSSIDTKLFNFKMQGSDTSLIRLRDLKGSIALEPLDNYPSVPVFKADLKCERASYRSPLNRFMARNNTLDLDLALVPEEFFRFRSRQARLDSLQLIYPNIERDSLFRHSMRVAQAKGDTTRLRRPRRGTGTDEFSFADIDLALERSIRQYIAMVDPRGSFSSQRIRITTPSFPLTSMLSDLELQMRGDTAILRSARIQAGDSKVFLHGSASHYKEFLTSREELKARLNLSADTLDLNQIMGAVQAGADFAAQAESGEMEALKAEMMQKESDEAVQKAITAKVGSAAEYQNLVVVPGNIDLLLHLNIKEARYANFNFKDFRGKARCKNRALQIDSLKTLTPIGDLTCSMVYSTANRNNLRAGFDILLNGCRVEDALTLIPSIDTLLPMLQSMEGLLNVKLAATASLDTAMNIVLSTARGACRLEGKDLVLLDGKTFTRIANLLQFDKKSRNLIDSINVNLTLADNKVEVYPFIMEWDKYQVAASGQHNLDMTFNYHISVLKSTVPFRVGLDITGTPEDLHFKVGKAKYRNALLPSYVKLINSECLQLNKTLSNFFYNPVL